MFLSYESYKDKKWCRTLTNKVENKLKLPAEELFTLDKYDIEKEDLVGCYYIYKGKKVFNTDSDVKNNADNGFFQNIKKWFQ